MKFYFEPTYRKRGFQYQLVWRAKDGRLLRPQLYRLHSSIPRAWGSQKQAGGAEKFMWFQLGRYMFTTM